MIIKHSDLNAYTNIKNKEFDIERLEKVRDIFVFACFTNLEDKKQREANHGNELIVRK